MGVELVLEVFTTLIDLTHSINDRLDRFHSEIIAAVQPAPGFGRPAAAACWAAYLNKRCMLLPFF